MTQPVHLSYATRDEVAASIARELVDRFERQGIEVSTSAQGRARHAALLVLLMSPCWWAEDAVQAPHHAEILRDTRGMITDGGQAMLMVPALATGEWRRVAPTELREASPFDLRPDAPHREAELDALVHVTQHALPRPQGLQPVS